MPLICPACGQTNADHARFCRSCSTPLTRPCPNCGQSVSIAARFCQHCSHSLTSSGPVGSSSQIPGATGRLNQNSLLNSRYLVVRKLGQGGMGAVYLATDQRLAGRQVAVKEMSDQAIGDAAERLAARQAFEQEAQILANLDHPNLPKVTDRFSEQGNQFLVMEFVDGQTLEKRLENAHGPLPEAEVRRYVEQLCDVLDYLHRQHPPIIFRDLKPANIMVRPDGKLRLIDFGIARHFKPGKSKDTQAMGTPGYAAPEQYGKGQSDARADIYALGATMHHMLTGRDPGVEPFKFPPVRALNAGAPQPLETVVMRAVQLDASQRWQSVRDLQGALVQKPPALAATTVVAPPPLTQPTKAPPPVVLPLPKPTTPPKSATPAATDIKRAGFGWTLIVAVSIGLFLASPYWSGGGRWAVTNFLGDMGIYYGGVIVHVGFIVMTVLAYLLTHRAGAVFCAYLATWAASMFLFGGGLYLSPIFSLLMGGAVIEGLLAMSRWRTRNLLALCTIVMGGIMLPAIFLGEAGFIFGEFVLIGLVVLIEMTVMLIISAIINSVTGIGRRP